MYTNDNKTTTSSSFLSAVAVAVAYPWIRDKYSTVSGIGHGTSFIITVQLLVVLLIDGYLV